VEDCGHFLSQTTEDWTSDKSYNFAITDVCKDAFLGSIALNKINRSHNSANVGYWVRQSRAGRGIASRALTLVAGFAFSELHFHRLEIVVPDGNIASQRVAQKAGAAFEGVHRQKIILNGKPHDGIVYSLINPSGAGPSCGG
jgi:RimJ/RimL family protein N-acetyltransferase